MKSSFKRLSLTDAAIVAGVLVLCGMLYAQNSKNPIQVALLRWYQMNSVTQFPGDNNCASPQNPVFDGAHIWVASSGGNWVDKL